ncbi:unnamed protein product, partial [Pylaiella littoralis]
GHRSGDTGGSSRLRRSRVMGGSRIGRSSISGSGRRKSGCSPSRPLPLLRLKSNSAGSPRPFSRPRPAKNGPISRPRLRLKKNASVSRLRPKPLPLLRKPPPPPPPKQKSAKLPTCANSW